MSLSDPAYDGYRNGILKALRNGISHERIRFCAFQDGDIPDINQLKGFLQFGAQYCFPNVDQTPPPKITPDEWFSIFDQVIASLENESNPVIGTEKSTTFQPSDDPDSCWMRYQWKLRNEKRYSKESVDSIRDSCVKIMRRLVDDSIANNNEAVKGLVVGNVQSGKTGSMAGVIAMAADAGYNFFIVLSGIIENLRQQTEERLIRDLSKVVSGNTYELDPKLRYSWFPLSHPEPNTDCPQLTSLPLAKESRERYLTVCLKQSNRLRSLIAYLQQNPNCTKNLKILVIDDECDQGSVNGANIDENEKSALYQLITGICNHEKIKGSYRSHKWRQNLCAGEPYKAINYIAYTATPYATLLNDARRESLFPRDFIVQLRPSKIYIGGRMFFGDAEGVPDSGFPGHPYLNRIGDEEVSSITRIQNGDLDSLPTELTKAIQWFLATAAILRVRGKENRKHNPVSMLIHTAPYTADHARLGELVERYLKDISSPFAEYGNHLMRLPVLQEIKIVYEEQCAKLSPEVFHTRYPWYGEPETPAIVDYPKFEALEPTLVDMLSYGPKHINIDEDLEFTYSPGIHFCIDNSKNNGVQNPDENGSGQYLRIKYPSPEDDTLGFEPLFIVIGGNTLARGLTLEGLTTTYFSRQVDQIDTLQQMGRFFGYRQGYELLPRIWISDAMRVNFRSAFLTDEGVRRQLEEMSEDFQLEDLRILVSVPKNGVRVTASNKSQNAVLVPALSGQKRELMQFSCNPETQRHNEMLMLSFIASLGAMQKGVAYGRNNYYATGVSWSAIRDTIAKYRFVGEVNLFPSIVAKYVDTHLCGMPWTVVFAGRSPHSDSNNNIRWNDGQKECVIGKNFRASFFRPDDNGGRLSFQSTTSATDLLTDIDPCIDCPPGTPPFVSSENVLAYRAKASVYGKGKTPVFLVTCINALDEQNKPVQGDLFGFSFGFPFLPNDEAAREMDAMFVGNLEE